MEISDNLDFKEKIAWALNEDRYANALYFAYQSNDTKLIKTAEWEVKLQCGSVFEEMKVITQRLLAISNKTKETR